MISSLSFKSIPNMYFLPTDVAVKTHEYHQYKIARDETVVVSIVCLFEYFKKPQQSSKCEF